MNGFGKLQEGLYHLKISKDHSFKLSKSSFVNNSISTTINDSNIWHFRLGHLSRNRLNVLHKKFPFISKSINENCDNFHLSKQRKLPYSWSISRASKIFELTHMDIWGHFPKTSVDGHKYFLTILYDYSRYTWIVLLNSKGEVQLHVKNFIHMIENQFEAKVKVIHFDNGPKFFLKDFLSSKGILHQTSCVATPQQNRRVERKH